MENSIAKSDFPRKERHGVNGSSQTFIEWSDILNDNSNNLLIDYSLYICMPHRGKHKP